MKPEAASPRHAALIRFTVLQGEDQSGKGGKSGPRYVPLPPRHHSNAVDRYSSCPGRLLLLRHLATTNLLQTTLNKKVLRALTALPLRLPPCVRRVDLHGLESSLRSTTQVVPVDLVAPQCFATANLRTPLRNSDWVVATFSGVKDT